jgi:hypothetical protein
MTMNEQILNQILTAVRAAGMGHEVSIKIAHFVKHEGELHCIDGRNNIQIQDGTIRLPAANDWMKYMLSVKTVIEALNHGLSTQGSKLRFTAAIRRDGTMIDVCFLRSIIEKAAMLSDLGSSQMHQLAKDLMDTEFLRYSIVAA